MAHVVGIDGYEGNYTARMSDGTTITFGRTQDPRWKDQRDPDRFWFVSIGSSSNHTTFIVETRPGMLENGGEWVVKQIKARGDDKSYWKAYAVAVLGS